MIIIETCPKCGHDLTDLVLACNPPIPQKKCFGCGWEWTGKQEEVIRVPFGGNSIDELKEYTVLNVSNFNLEDSLIGSFEQSACINCTNNPKNGGSGICHCILGQMQIT